MHKSSTNIIFFITKGEFELFFFFLSKSLVQPCMVYFIFDIQFSLPWMEVIFEHHCYICLCKCYYNIFFVFRIAVSLLVAGASLIMKVYHTVKLITMQREGRYVPVVRNQSQEDVLLPCTRNFTQNILFVHSVWNS